MQRKKKTVQEQLVLMMAGLLWVTGLLLAGSDNPYMPWSNLGGLVLFYGATVMMARRLETPGRHSLGTVKKIKSSSRSSGSSSIPVHGEASQERYTLTWTS
ncbi:MAG: hypothetical protein JEZ12_14410 [Desulfobacterium sp.]|nr:hypothetical protein [Desulfobacterium sp.]